MGESRGFGGRHSPLGKRGIDVMIMNRLDRGWELPIGVNQQCSLCGYDGSMADLYPSQQIQRCPQCALVFWAGDRGQAAPPAPETSSS